MANEIEVGDCKLFTGFRREEISSDLISEALPLLQAHHDEVMPRAEKVRIDRIKYLQMARLGVIRCFVVRKEGKLVGYANFFVCLHPHYREVRQALCDVLYLSPKYRGGGGVRFIRWCDAQLEAEGVHEIHYTVTERHDYSRTLERMGYAKQSRVFSKRMNDVA